MAKKINDFIYYVGVLNPNSRISDVIVKTDFGTSYNSFLIKDKKIALVETCHSDFFEDYLENIKEICDLDSIDYIILNHTEPDHSGALKKIIKLASKAKIICSKAGAIYLKNILCVQKIFISIELHKFFICSIYIWIKCTRTIHICEISILFYLIHS